MAAGKRCHSCGRQTVAVTGRGKLVATAVLAADCRSVQLQTRAPRNTYELRFKIELSGSKNFKIRILV